MKQNLPPASANLPRASANAALASASFREPSASFRDQRVAGNCCWYAFFGAPRAPQQVHAPAYLLRLRVVPAYLPTFSGPPERKALTRSTCPSQAPRRVRPPSASFRDDFKADGVPFFCFVWPGSKKACKAEASSQAISGAGRFRFITFQVRPARLKIKQKWQQTIHGHNHNQMGRPWTSPHQNT